MNTKVDPRELAFLVAARANDLYLPYQMGAVIVDRSGRVVSWGWNHRGDNAKAFSIHAERHAIMRANPARLKNSTLYVAGIRRGTERVLCAMPCKSCWDFVKSKGIVLILWSDPTNAWARISKN